MKIESLDLGEAGGVQNYFTRTDFDHLYVNTGEILGMFGTGEVTGGDRTKSVLFAGIYDNSSLIWKTVKN